jgi:putative transposase
MLWDIFHFNCLITTVQNQMKKRFNKSEILKILQEYNEGTPISIIIEKQGISKATFYNWKAKYGDLSYSDSVKLLKLLEENDKLKKMYVELSLEYASVKTQLYKREQH